MLAVSADASRQEPPGLAILAARLELLRQAEALGPVHRFILGGHVFEIDSGVFSPEIFESSRVFASLLEANPVERFLDMGTGCGIIAIVAALRGTASVVAVDVSPAAVANTKRNIERLRLTDNVTVLLSDVFDAVPPKGQFDTIFWNAPWIPVPADYELGSVLERAICDPGYAAIGRYFEGAASRLAPNGRLLIGLGPFGEVEEILALARRSGWAEVGERGAASPSDPEIRYTIHEFRPAGTGLEC